MELMSRERTLASRIFLPLSAATPSSTPGILFVHGLGSSQAGYLERAQRAAVELGVTCLTFDLSGHGESAGLREQLTPTDHLDDLTSAYDLLAAQSGVEPHRIGICGSSYGAYLAPFLARHRQISHMLLRAPALYGDDMLRTPWAFSRRSSTQAAASQLATAVKSFDGELLILESERDSVLPPGVIEWYIKAARHARRAVLSGAGHALKSRKEQEEFLHEIVDFFRTM